MDVFGTVVRVVARCRYKTDRTGRLKSRATFGETKLNEVRFASGGGQYFASGSMISVREESTASCSVSRKHSRVAQALPKYVRGEEADRLQKSSRARALCA